MKKDNVRSVIQPDFNDLLDTGYYCIHHVFQGVNRRRCEKYGFLVALRPKAHDKAHEAANTGKQAEWKRECQRYFEQNIGTREQFIQEFGRNYL